MGLEGANSMNDFAKDFIKNTSVPLDGGGDTHFHSWENGRGFTATTRLPGSTDVHKDFRFHEMSGQRTPPRPDVMTKIPW